MRKHFLLLFLMALLPLAGFAQDIIVTPANASKTYGTPDPNPAVNTGIFTATGMVSSTKAAVGATLDFIRSNTSENVGTYPYTLEWNGDQVDSKDVVVSGNGQLTIKPKKLNTFSSTDANNKITLKLKTGHEQYQVGTGTTQLKPTAADFDIIVDLGVDALDGNLEEGTDFTIKSDGYGTNKTSAAGGTLTIVGMGNYTGEIVLNFPILAPDIATFGTPQYIGTTAMVFKNDEWKPAAADFKIGTLLGSTAAFTVKTGSYKNNVNAGTAEVTLVGNGTDCAGEIKANFTIAKLEVNNTSAPFVATQATPLPQYTGEEIKPTFSTLTVKGFDLQATDYTLSNLATAAGNHTAKLTFTEKSNFSGPVQDVPYTIAPRDFQSTPSGNIIAEFAKNTSDVEITDYQYENKDVKPAVTVKLKLSDTKSVTLTEGTDYELTYAGTATSSDLKSVEAKTLTIKGMNNFTDATIVKNYNIVNREVKVRAADLTVGMGSDIAPVASYDSFAEGHTAAGLNVNPIFYYKKLNASGVETGSAISYLKIKTEPVGKYNIHVRLSGTGGLNTAAAAATNDLKYYTFAEPTTVGVLTKTASQVVVKVKNRHITYGDGVPGADGSWQIEHVSGLSEADQVVDPSDLKTTVLETIIGQVAQAKFKVTGLTVGDKVDANETGYEVTYEGGSIAIDNYAVTVESGKLIVDKKTIGATEAIAAVNYAGKQVEIAVDIKPSTATAELVSGKLPTDYYTVELSSKWNAGYHMAHISLTEKGQKNYKIETVSKTWGTGDLEVIDGDKVYKAKENITYLRTQYTINKLPLTFTADNFTGDNAWTYGTTEPTYTAKLTGTDKPVAGEENLITSLLAGEQPAGFNGKLVVKRTSATTVGDHVGALAIQFVDSDDTPLDADAAGTNFSETAAAQNYKITVVAGDLQVKKGALVVKVKPASVIYGEAVTGFELMAVSGLAEADAANFNSIVDYDQTPAKFGYADGDNKKIGGKELTYAGKEPTATNYDITWDATAGKKGMMTVEKRPILVRGKQTLAATYTVPMTWTSTVAAAVEVPVEETVEGKKYYTLITPDDVTTVIEKVEAATLNAGENEVVLTAKESAIYDIDVISGKLTITGTFADITLNRVAKASYADDHSNTAASTIELRDGEICNVKFSGNFTMYGQKWYPVVLPFATNVVTLSQKFGYAVVDTFEGTDANGNIKFKLAFGEIPANTPFIIKIIEDKKMDDVSFNTVKIEKAHDANGEVKIGDASGVQFVGTYKGRIDGFRSNMYYFSTTKGIDQYYKGNDTNTTYLRPLGAYFVDNSADAASAARMISIEEADGTTTAISAIAADGSFVEADGWYTLNGVKLQGAPTEKGVYVRNGKKVVIK